MIVVDTSAVVAIFQNEEDAATYAQAIETADRLAISAVNAHETAMILHARHGGLGRQPEPRFELRQPLCQAEHQLDQLLPAQGFNVGAIHPKLESRPSHPVKGNPAQG